jgi:mercuric ion binding protein
MGNAMKYAIAIMSLFMSASLFADKQSVVLSVPGMKCPACPITVMVAIKRVKGVKSVNVSLENKQAEVSYDDQLTDISKLQVATKNVGFPSQVINDNSTTMD